MEFDMNVFLALIAVLVPASVALVGFWNKRQSEKRLTQEKEQSEKELSEEHERSERRLAQEQRQENDRLKLDAAMHAADLFGSSGDAQATAAKSGAGLLALARLSFADLSVALLVDLWSPLKGQAVPAKTEGPNFFGVSTETAIQVIDEALKSGKPEAQLMAAALLCRNASALDICDPLHWPVAVNSAWIPELPVTAKFLIVDALVHMALASEPTTNALRELAVRLYGVFRGDPEPRVKGCIGTLMRAIMPAVRALGYTDFMKGPGHGLVRLEDMEQAAADASPHPDGYFEMIVKDRSEKLEQWSLACKTVSLSPGKLATASSALRETHKAGQ